MKKAQEAGGRRQPRYRFIVKYARVSREVVIDLKASSLPLAYTEVIQRVLCPQDLFHGPITGAPLPMRGVLKNTDNAIVRAWNRKEGWLLRSGEDPGYFEAPVARTPWYSEKRSS